MISEIMLSLLKEAQVAATDKDENTEQPTPSTVTRAPEEALEKLHMARVCIACSTCLPS